MAVEMGWLAKKSVEKWGSDKQKLGIVCLVLPRGEREAVNLEVSK